MKQAYLIAVRRVDADVSACRGLRYAALAETPEEAIATVRRLVAADADLCWTGDTLSAVAASAVGLRPGQARLV